MRGGTLGFFTGLLSPLGLLTGHAAPPLVPATPAPQAAAAQESSEERDRMLAVGDAYRMAPADELLMPGAGRRVSLFDGIIPEEIARSLEEHVRRTPVV